MDSIPGARTRTARHHPARAQASAGGPKRLHQAPSSRSEHHRRTWQHLCLRSFVPIGNPPKASRGFDFSGAVAAAGAGHPRCPGRSNCGGRLDTSRFRVAGRRARLFFEKLFCLRPRGSAMCLRGQGQTHRPGWPLNLLLFQVPALTFGALRGRGRPLRCEPVGRAVFH